MEKIVKHPTYFVDIDGTLIVYRKFVDLEKSVLTPIQDMIDFINKSYNEGVHIVITTARPELFRNLTIQELSEVGVNYHQLIMGIGRGSRIIFNDLDPEKKELPRAWGINLERDSGLKDIKLPIFISSYESN
jgi:hydroxymethylpyrimidine pyrophosphatase-like HAD family hydrolase